MKNMGSSKKMTILKMEFDLLATFQRRSKHDKSVDNRCFRCQRLNKNFNHVIRCPAAASHRGKIWETVSVSVIKGAGSCLHVAQKFQEGMLQWLKNEQLRWEGPIRLLRHI